MTKEGLEVTTLGDGRTPLGVAAQNGNLTVIQWLLAAGANINGGSPPPAFAAAKGGHEEVFDFLVKHGASLQTKWENPLHYVCSGGNTEMTRHLIKHGVNVNKEGRYGSTPLGEACFAKQSGQVAVLLQAGADYPSFDDGYRSPMNWAIITRNIQMVFLFLVYGAGIGRPLPRHEDALKLYEAVNDLIKTYRYPVFLLGTNRAECFPNAVLAFDPRANYTFETDQHRRSVLKSCVDAKRRWLADAFVRNSPVLRGIQDLENHLRQSEAANVSVVASEPIARQPIVSVVTTSDTNSALPALTVNNYTGLPELFEGFAEEMEVIPCSPILRFCLSQQLIYIVYSILTGFLLTQLMIAITQFQEGPLSYYRDSVMIVLSLIPMLMFVLPFICVPIMECYLRSARVGPNESAVIKRLVQALELISQQLTEYQASDYRFRSLLEAVSSELIAVIEQDRGRPRMRDVAEILYSLRLTLPEIGDMVTDSRNAWVHREAWYTGIRFFMNPLPEGPVAMSNLAQAPVTEQTSLLPASTTTTAPLSQVVVQGPSYGSFSPASS